MSKIVISEFMDEAAIRDELSGFDTLYDPSLVDRPDALAAVLRDADAVIVRNRTQMRGALLAGSQDLKAIGRFSHFRSLLKALQFYDALSVLPSACMDSVSSYRYDAAAQLRDARLAHAGRKKNARARMQ